MDVDHSGSGDTNKRKGPKAYIPGRSRPLKENEELVMDKSAYRMFYELQVESPSLSFDILLDNLGFERDVELNGQPTSTCLVAGTQAPPGMKNNLVVMKLHNLRPFTKNTENDEEEDSSDDEDLDSKPEVESATISHKGTVNRVRAHQVEGRYLAASWSELGKFFIWDLTRPLTAVNDSVVMSDYVRRHESPLPLFTQKYPSEGFALDWSSHSNASGHLAVGNCDGLISHMIPHPTGWKVGKKNYVGHTGSVEDIQWSPTEPTVFISVSADRTIRVWDVRSPPGSGSMLTVPEAHGADINVTSWNRLQPAHLVTGGDDGLIRVWDLRLVNKRYSNSDAHSLEIPAFIQSYDFHNKPITSVQWHPTDCDVLVATADDDQVTLWDTTLEQADEESNSVDRVTANLPVQLLFIHCGQTEVKEAHWHPQIPGLLLVTSLNGFNVFRTCNV